MSEFVCLSSNSISKKLKPVAQFSSGHEVYAVVLEKSRDGSFKITKVRLKQGMVYPNQILKAYPNAIKIVYSRPNKGILYTIDICKASRQLGYVKNETTVEKIENESVKFEIYHVGAGKNATLVADLGVW